MENLATLRPFERTLELFKTLYGVDPDGGRRRPPPGYLSHALGREQPRDAAPRRDVQHHHAHVAAVLAEHGSADAPVIGVAFDGTGSATTATIWGGEVLVADPARPSASAHLAPVPLPGGDAAVRHPWRIALA